jgi:hypothetical protein
MLRRRTSLFAAIMVMLAAPAFAQDAPPVDVVGSWDYTFDTPEGVTTWRVTFAMTDGALTGQAVSDYGTLAMTNAKLEGPDVSFAVKINYNGEMIDLYFAGKVQGDATDGAIAVPVADMSIPFKGKRVMV